LEEIMISTCDFLSVEATDTFAYAHMRFDFLSGIHQVSGANGVGKSSIFLTLCQGLYNKSPKGGKIDEVNNIVTGGLSEITVCFRKGADRFKVINSRKNGKIEIYKNDGARSIAPKGISPSLKLIEDLLGCAYETFVELVYRNSHSSLALVEEAGDSARKAFIGKVLRWDELDQLHEKAKAKVKECEKEAQLLERNQANLENSLLELKPVVGKEAIEPLEREIEKAEAALRQSERAADGLERLTQQLRSDLQGAEKAAGARERIATIEEALGRFSSPYATLEKVEERQEELRDADSQTQHDLSVAEKAACITCRQTEIEEALEQLGILSYPLEEAEAQRREAEGKVDEYTRMESVAHRKLAELARKKPEDTCPTCGHELDNAKALEIYQDETSRAQQAFKKAKEELPKWQSALKAAGGELKRHALRERLLQERDLLGEPPQTCDLRDLAERESRLPGCFEEAKLELHKHKRKIELEHELALLKTTPLLETEAGDIERQLLEMAAARKAENDNSQALKNSLMNLKIRLTNRREHNTIQATCEAYNREAEANNTRVREQITENTADLVQAIQKKTLAERWVGILGRNGYRLQQLHRFLKSLNSTMQQYADMISNGRIVCQFYLDEAGKIAFSVTDADKSLAYSMWSDGEKERVKLACLFSVLELLEVTGGTGFNLLFLDEVFASLDEAGREGLFRVLEFLKGRGKGVYTIAHSPITNAVVFDSFVQAYKEKGLAQIFQRGDYDHRRGKP
jgi:DNA repair exonuclease SbcCD ATPase subunit